MQVKFLLRNCFLLVIFAGFMACNPAKEEKKVYKVNESTLKKQFIEANKQVVQKENDNMDSYVASHQMPFVKTTSSIRYYVYKASAKGDSIRDGDEITMEFTVSLLDGTECYSSKEKGAKTFFVGAEDLESGIHRGVKLLKNGDKAILLIPSHLAHGLLGDMNKIPPQMPIVYDVEITKVKKSQNN